MPLAAGLSAAAAAAALLVCVVTAAALSTDGLALLALKSAVSEDPAGVLSRWRDTDASPCRWRGVACDAAGRVASLSLPGASLRGYLPSELSLLSVLRALSLPRNRLHGPIPSSISALAALADLDLSHNLLAGAVPPGISLLAGLASLDLSHNRLSGSLPASLVNLTALARLDLSSNLLNGSLPPALASLPHLAGVMNLSNNHLSGRIPPEYGYLPVSLNLDLRGNNLSGEIPQVSSLLNQGPTAFSGNPYLCGFPLKNSCVEPEQQPRFPFISPNLTSTPALAAAGKGKKGFAVPLLVGILLVAVASAILLQWRLRRRRLAENVDRNGDGNAKAKLSAAAVELEERRGGGRGEEVYVAVDEGFGVELEELLRASSYVVGKSRAGIVYRVVVGGHGGAVAVRRLSETDDVEGEEVDELRRRRSFEAEAVAIGRARHPNVVQLRAYYYAPDERLLIYDYIPNGTLHSALHAGSSQHVGSDSVSSLAWAVRLSIIQGAARGLAYLHDSSPRRNIHGNIKTSKILLGDHLNPYISGFGLTQLISGSTRKVSHSISRKLSSSQLAAASTNGAYLAPEARIPGNTLNQKSDVYSFGIVLLEVLTGRHPGARSELYNVELERFVRRAFKEERPLSEVVDPSLLHEIYAKKQVLNVFHVALGCIDADPEMRPRMRAVSENLDRIVAPQ